MRGAETSQLVNKWIHVPSLSAWTSLSHRAPSASYSRYAVAMTGLVRTTLVCRFEPESGADSHEPQSATTNVQEQPRRIPPQA